ncbi:MAG: helix-turn-helix domain-containing protein [Acidimicrobiia bacterium]|nr:helix-turn-helix domain-containing protein [Acidimicrobiia bacterium]
MPADTSSVVLIKSLSQIEALSNPLRNRILNQAREPVTVAELAERFDVPNTRLYYHVNLLVEEGMLEQVDERKSGARIEKIYLRTAAEFQLDPGLAEAIGDPRKAAEAAASLIFDSTRTESEALLAQILAGEDPTAQLGRTILRLTAEDAERFAERMEQLLVDLREASRNQRGELTYSYTVAFIPIDDLGEAR